MQPINYSKRYLANKYQSKKDIVMDAVIATASLIVLYVGAVLLAV